MKKGKSKYSKPEIDLIKLSYDDIIATSTICPYKGMSDNNDSISDLAHSFTGVA